MRESESLIAAFRFIALLFTMLLTGTSPTAQAQANSNVAIAITATPDPVRPGELVQYVVTATNRSAVGHSFRVSAQVPNHTTVAAGAIASGGCGGGVSTCPAGATISWDFGNNPIAPGQSATVQFAALVDSTNPPPNGTIIRSTASVVSSGIDSATAGVDVVVSSTGLSASITALPVLRANTSVPLAWSGTGALNYDVLYTRAAYNSAYGAPVVWKKGSTAKSATFSAAPGFTYCFQVRARSVSGTLSDLTKQTCTAVPLDERSMTKTGSWTAGAGRDYYNSTFLQSKELGAKLVRSGAQAKRIAIVATTCPTCGKLSVYWDAKLLKTVSLVSSKTINRRLISIATFPAVKSGTVTLKVASNRKQVLLDGVVLSRQ